MEAVTPERAIEPDDAGEAPPAVVGVRPWRIQMAGRDPLEENRASTPLELLFDLCFVVGRQLVWTGTASSTVRPLATLPLIVPSSWTPPSSPKTPSEARLTRARFVTLWL